MKTIIEVYLGRDHVYKCNTDFIGRSGENESTQFQIKFDDCLCNSWVYMDFVKPDGTKYKTPKLDIVDNIVIYDVTNELLTDKGILKAQVVLQDESGIVWKSTVKTYEIIQSIDATDDIPEKEDFIHDAQTLLNEIEEGLTPTIGDNENWFVGDKDTGKPSRGPKGDSYVITDEDYQEIETNVKSDIQPILENIENVASQAEIIARGRATGYTFKTVEDLDLWLQDETNVSKLTLGDNFYIIATDVPDYWWDGTQKRVLETEKPDLTAYAKKEQFVTMTQAEYDGLTEKSTNTYYFIVEEE